MNDEEKGKTYHDVLCQLIRKISLAKVDLVALEQTLIDAHVVSLDHLKQNRVKFRSRIQKSLDRLDGSSDDKLLQILLQHEGPIN